jgi:uncharacterized membrane protein YbhN (UPF0104 family)
VHADAAFSQVRDNGGVSDQHESPGRGRVIRESVDQVTVRRAPRYYRFMVLGLIVGVVVTLVLTFAFPEQDEFNRFQVFGFTGIFITGICVGLGAVVAIVLDRVSRRRARTVSVERIEESGTGEA